jgi:hypothetical protein
MPDSNVHMVDPSTIPGLPQGPVAFPQQPPQPSQQFGQGGNTPQNGIPLFEIVPVRYASGEYVNVEYVNILTPGDPKSVPRHKVTDIHRQMYKPWYDAWKQGQVMAPVGTPLEMWPILTPAMVHTLKAVNIFTVEQLAGVADSNIHRIPMGHDLKNKAVAWLKEKKDVDSFENSRREKEAMAESLRMQDEKIASLQQALEKATAAMSAQPVAEVRRGPGRPPRVPDAA